MFKCKTCYSNYFANVTSYKIVPNATTSKGIKVDTASNFNTDLEELDRRIDKIEACMLEEMRKLPLLTEQQRQEWQCPDKGFIAEELKRECVQIKVVSAVVSECSAWQLLPVLAPNKLCLDKGVIPTIECPCRWRTVVQDDYRIITPPAMYLWELPRVMTGCNNIWKSPFAKCTAF